MRLLRSLARDRKGSAAIEFAILALPFFVVIFAIAEIAVMYFVDSGLDAAVHKAVRQVRVGVAKSGNWDAAKFKQVVCGELSYSFDCTSKLKVRATVITDMASITKASPISCRASDSRLRWDLLFSSAPASSRSGASSDMSS